MATGDTGTLLIQVLGRIGARIGDEEIDLGPPKQRALLTLLAIRANTRVGLDEVVDTLWAGGPPRSAQQLVHTYVARLRQSLEPWKPKRQRTTVISSVAGGYRLNLDDDALDVLTFRKLTRQAGHLLESDQWAASFDLLGRALRVWDDVSLGEMAGLLPNRHEVEQLQQEWVAAGVDLVGLGLAHDRTAAVLPIAERLARLAPLNETVQVRHLEALGRTGQRAAALTSYAEVRSRLRGELGVDPGPQLARTFQQLLDAPAPPGPAGDPAERPPRPPWRGYGAAVEDIVGRDREITQFGRMLSQHRLVTLTGTAGAGKSALALAVARDARESYTGGVVVADMSGAYDESELCTAIRAVLGGAEQAEPGDIVAQLSARETLLVLDNVERVVDEAARFVDRLLRRTQMVTVLVSSRELLGLPYEAVRQVWPLRLPRPADESTPDRLAAIPSVELFVRRTAQVRPYFTVTPENAPFVAAVCRLLDGLPLALELAAAALRTRQMRDLVECLGDPLDHLVPPRRGSPAHHRSLRAAVLRSVESMGRNEQVCLAALSALPGEFCQHRAHPVVGDISDLTVVLDRLVDKSLLMVRHDRGGSHYRMLRVIRALGRELSRGLVGALPSDPAAVPCPCSDVR